MTVGHCRSSIVARPRNGVSIQLCLRVSPYPSSSHIVCSELSCRARKACASRLVISISHWSCPRKARKAANFGFDFDFFLIFELYFSYRTVYYQTQTANRFKSILHDGRDPLAQVLARRPFYVVSGLLLLLYLNFS